MKIKCWRCRLASWKNASWRRASSRRIWKKNRKFSRGPERLPAWRPWTSERWRSRCDALEESLISNGNQLQVPCLRSSLYFNYHLLNSNSLCRTGLVSACKVTNVQFSLFVKNSPWIQRSRRRRGRWVRRKKWMINRGKVKGKERGRKTGVHAEIHSTEEEPVTGWTQERHQHPFPWNPNRPPTAYLPHPLLSSPSLPCTLNPPNQTPEPHLTHSVIQTLYPSPSPSHI